MEGFPRTVSYFFFVNHPYITVKLLLKMVVLLAWPGGASHLRLLVELLPGELGVALGYEGTQLALWAGRSSVKFFKYQKPQFRPYLLGPQCLGLAYWALFVAPTI